MPLTFAVCSTRKWVSASLQLAQSAEFGRANEERGFLTLSGIYGFSCGLSWAGFRCQRQIATPLRLVLGTAVHDGDIIFSSRLQPNISTIGAHCAGLLGQQERCIRSSRSMRWMSEDFKLARPRPESPAVRMIAAPVADAPGLSQNPGGANPSPPACPPEEGAVLVKYGKTDLPPLSFKCL